MNRFGLDSFLLFWFPIFPVFNTEQVKWFEVHRSKNYSGVRSHSGVRIFELLALQGIFFSWQALKSSSTYSYLEYVIGLLFFSNLYVAVPFFTDCLSSLLRSQNNQATLILWYGYSTTVIYMNQCLMNKMTGDTLLRAEKENLLHLRQANTPVNKIPLKWKKKKEQRWNPG